MRICFCVELIEPERRRRPADVDLPRHHRRQVRGRASHRGRLGLELVLLHEGRDDAVRRRPVGRVGENLVVGVLERLDRGIRLHIPVKVIGARCFRADHAHGRAFGIGAEHAHDTGGNADIDAARNHRLLRLARAIGVDDLQLQAMFLEDAGELADFRHRSVPVAALADRQFHLVLRAGGGHSEQCQRRKCGRERLFSHRESSQSFFAAIWRLVVAWQCVRAALRCRRRDFASSLFSERRLRMS